MDFNYAFFRFCLFSATILSLAACSGVNFDKQQEAAVSASSSSQLPPKAPDNTQTNTPASSTSAAIPAVSGSPKIAFQIPDCQANTTCMVTVTLSQTSSVAIKFDWKTNDTKYLQDPVTYAQPNKNYVPASGTVLFPAGNTVQTLGIQSLDGFVHILIPFNWFNCSAGGVTVDCSTFQ